MQEPARGCCLRRAHQNPTVENEGFLRFLTEDFAEVFGHPNTSIPLTRFCERLRGFRDVP